MKKSDIAMIILVSSIGLLLSYFAMNFILGKPSEDKVTIKTIDKIETDVVEPNEIIFNKKAINPTVEIIIGES